MVRHGTAEGVEAAMRSKDDAGRSRIGQCSLERVELTERGVPQNACGFTGQVVQHWYLTTLE